MMGIKGSAIDDVSTARRNKPNINSLLDEDSNYNETKLPSRLESKDMKSLSLAQARAEIQAREKRLSARVTPSPKDDKVVKLRRFSTMDNNRQNLDNITIAVDGGGNNVVVSPD